MEDLKIKEATPEQRKEIAKIMVKARLDLLGTSAKFALGLFSANFITISIGKYFLKDTDPDMQLYFQFISVVINMIFMTLYLDGKLKKNSDIVVSKIKEILKNDKT